MAYAILIVCNVVPEAPSSISHEKIQAIQKIRLNSIWSRSLHMYISGPSRQTKYKVIRSTTLYPATGQTFSRTLSKKIKLSASHAMLRKPMQSCPAVPVKCRDQDCISNYHWIEHYDRGEGTTGDIKITRDEAMSAHELNEICTSSLQLLRYSLSLNWNISRDYSLRRHVNFYHLLWEQLIAWVEM